MSRFSRLCSVTLALATCGLAPIVPSALQAKKELPRYGDTFPLGTVDYYGLTTINDYGPLKPVPTGALALSQNKEYSKALDKLKAHLAKDKNDLTAYVIFVHISDTAGRVDDAVKFMRDARMAGYGPNAKTGKPEMKPLTRAFQIADVYAQLIWTTRAPIGANAGVRGTGSQLFDVPPASRLEAMILTSYLWWKRELKQARMFAEKHLARDPDFYQLRVFYAYLWGRGQGATRYGNGTIDYSTEVDGDPVMVMKHANMVIKSHPEYTPAFFVARLSSDNAEKKRNLTRFMLGCHPESEWYEQAKAALARLK